MRAPIAAALSLILLTAAPIAAAKRQGGEAELAKAIGNRQPGQPVSCIDPNDTNSVQVIDGTAIVYGDGSRLYVNRTMDPKPLRRDDILVAPVFGGQLCRLDSIKLLERDTSIPRGFVVLGNFVPYTRPR